MKLLWIKTCGLASQTCPYSKCLCQSVIIDLTATTCVVSGVVRLSLTVRKTKHAVNPGKVEIPCKVSLFQTNEKLLPCKHSTVTVAILHFIMNKVSDANHLHMGVPKLSPLAGKYLWNTSASLHTQPHTLVGRYVQQKSFSTFSSWSTMHTQDISDRRTVLAYFMYLSAQPHDNGCPETLCPVKMSSAFNMMWSWYLSPRGKDFHDPLPLVGAQENLRLLHVDGACSGISSFLCTSGRKVWSYERETFLSCCWDTCCTKTVPGIT